MVKPSVLFSSLIFTFIFRTKSNDFQFNILCIFVAVPILESNTYVSSMEYSPLIGGFAITLNDGRAAYLTANSLKFDPNVRKFQQCNRKVHKNYR